MTAPIIWCPKHWMSEPLSPSRLAGRSFARMNGIGNAIVVLDLRGSDLIVTAAEARAIAALPGLRFDQLMAIHDPRAPGTDAHMRIYNVDGSRSAACGNGTRCVAAFLGRGTDRDNLALTVGDARLDCRRVDEATVSVDMGAPELRFDRVPLRDDDPASLEFPPWGRGVAVGMGNPHVVFFVPDAHALDLDALDLATVGPPIERAPAFPHRVNVSFAQVVDAGAIRLRVWERGAGATLACGSGACATLVAGALSGRTGREATVDLPGGRLAIAWRADGHVIMTGGVAWEFEGLLGAARNRGRAA